MQTTVAQSSPEQATSGASRSGSAEKTTPGKAAPLATTPGREGATEKVTLMSPAESRSLIEALLRSEIYQEYERAFSEATGLVLSLRPVETWRLTHHGKRNESPFCSLMSETSRSCAACLQVQERLVAMAVEGARTINCFAGMSDTAVPIRLGNQVIGFLQTGQVFRKRPTRSQFAKVCQTLEQWGLQYDRRRLEEAFFKTRVLPPRQHESVVRLLTIFAQHLSMISNQVLLQQKNAEPPVITRAKEYILEHMAEDLSLARVAKAVNTSTFYFCKMFKKATGINFTDYLSRVRIEKAKNLLLNPNLRVSEIAFEVGFQSLTHFNRVFKKILGQSPTQYRAQLLGR